MTTLHHALASVEADLISSAADGERAVYAQLLTKLAELQLDVDDRLAVIDMLAEEATASKEANFAPFNQPSQDQSGPPNGGISPNVVRALLLGSVIAGPAVAGYQALAASRRKSDALAKLYNDAPDVASHPRFESHFQLLHSMAPTIAENAPVAADLIRQMQSMPQLDLGTVGRLADINKSMRSDGKGSPSGPLSGITNAVKDVGGLAAGASMLSTGKMAAKYKGADGTPTVFNWGTESAKTAGLTDAFTGSGSVLDQATNAQSLNQQMQQYPLIPLDAVVRELLMKEQELSQREQSIMMQEQALQAAQAQQGEMSGQYQSEYGVDPTTGQPMGDEQGQPAEDPSMEGEDPAAAMGAEDPSMGQEDPNAEIPVDASQAQMDVGSDTVQDQVAPEDSTMDNDAPSPEEQAALENAQPPEAQETGDQFADPTYGNPNSAPEDSGPAAAPNPTDVRPGEAVEGTEQAAEDHHTGPGSPEEESPYDNQLDENLAGRMDAAGEEPVPEGQPLPEDSVANDQAEAIEGSQQDLENHHVGAGAFPEGSPEDQTADQSLAQNMAANGEQPVPQGAPLPPSSVALPPVNAPAAGPTPTVNGDGSMTITVPLPSIQVTMKMAHPLDEALAEARRSLTSFFRAN